MDKSRGFTAILVNRKDGEGDTPLHLAVNFRKVEILKELLSHGADPTIEDTDGHTPLQRIAKSRRLDYDHQNYSEMVTLLEEAIERRQAAS